jgi:peptidoglycan/xylan/chitin deacetylase (PgdA/CDA1 family)
MLVILFHPRRWLLERGPRSPATAVPGRDHVRRCRRPRPPRVLDILRDKEVKATFFLVGRQVELNPELARRMSREGHAVGNHTYSHPPLFCFLSPRRLREEIARTQAAVLRVTGARPRVFRSPVGLRHPILKLALEREALEFVLWELRTYDTSARSRDPAPTNPGSRVPGAIVLLHDRPGQAHPRCWRRCRRRRPAGTRFELVTV